MAATRSSHNGTKKQAFPTVSRNNLQNIHHYQGQFSMISLIVNPGDARGCARNDGFCTRNDGLCTKDDGFALKMTDFVLEMMEFVLTTMDFFQHRCGCQT